MKMKKSKIYFLASSLLLLSSLKAQEIQWANKLIKYTSDLGGKQYGIKRVLGKPDVFPQTGNSPNAWTPKNSLNGREIIVVGFEKTQTVKQIAVFENLNAGCVNRMFVSTDGEKFEPVWNREKDYKTPLYRTTLQTDRSYYFKRKRRKVQEAPDVLNPGIEYAILENAVSGVVAVKIEFNFALLPGQKQIDAIGISDSETKIEAKINSVSRFENIQNPENISLDGLVPSSPIVSFDGKKLFFTENSNESERIFSCTKNTIGKWENPKEENTNLSQNKNYNYILAHQPNFILKGGLPYSKGTNESGYEFLDSNYQSTGQLKITAFNNYDDNSSATITNDKKTLILGIETDFTQGGNDLYYTTQKEDGAYGLLQNMGKVINSAADEGGVFLLSDQKTLLFSSNGFSSFGDYDIYVSYRLDDSWKKWSEPINLGSKINSSDFEGSPFYDEKTETLYFTKWIDNQPRLSFVKIPLKDLVQN